MDDNSNLSSYHRTFIFLTFVFLIGIPFIWVLRFSHKKYMIFLEANKNKSIISRIKNLGIIMDGNRRWAKKYGYSNEQGYEEGANKFLETVRLCLKKGIPFLTVYALSADNIKNRTKEEIDAIYKIMKLYLNDKLDLMIKQGIRIKIVGDTKLFNNEINNLIIETEKKTEKKGELTICLLFGYDPLEDIFYGVNAIKKDIEKGLINKTDEISPNLYIRSKDIPNIDLIIRTGGYERLSGFLPIQSMYAELVFFSCMWPAINVKDIEYIIDKFHLRTRNFGI